MSYSNRPLNFEEFLQIHRDFVKDKEYLKRLDEFIKKLSTSTCRMFKRGEMEFAVENEDLELMKELRNRGCHWNYNTSTYIYKHGNLEIVKWLKQNGCPFGYYTLSAAIKSGKLETIKWLKENGCPFEDQAMIYAVGTGNVEIVKWMKENGCQWHSKSCIMEEAVEKGHLEMLKWLKENDGLEYSHGVRFYNKNKEINEWLDCHFTYFGAIQREDLDTIKYLYSKDVIYKKHTIQDALDKGNFQILQWFVEHETPKKFGYEVENLNSLEWSGLRMEKYKTWQLQWLYDKGCDFGELNWKAKELGVKLSLWRAVKEYLGFKK